jgi:hypothetical protein
MSRGGRREGAGRPAGSRDKRIYEKEAEVAASGITPLDYLLSLVRNPDKDEALRTDAAKAAAPYCHARLVSTQNTHSVQMTVEEVLRSIVHSDRQP